MRVLLRIGLVAGMISALASPAVAKRHGKSHRTASPSPHKPNEAKVEAATRLQVFLDRANFSPGKIDGHYNDVTLKALTLYLQSRGEPTPPPPTKPDSPPDLSGIDLASVNPVFIQYSLTDA